MRNAASGGHLPTPKRIRGHDATPCLVYGVCTDLVLTAEAFENAADLERFASEVICGHAVELVYGVALSVADVQTPDAATQRPLAAVDAWAQQWFPHLQPGWHMAVRGDYEPHVYVFADASPPSK